MTARLAAVDTWCGSSSWRPSSVHIQCASTVHDNHYPLSFIPTFNLRTPARAGRASVSQCPATSGPAPREVLPSTSNVAPVLDWAGRVPTHASLHPATKPRILSIPKPFNLPAESMPIARAAPPPQSGFVQLVSCAIPRALSLAPVFVAAGPRKETSAFCETLIAQNRLVEGTLISGLAGPRHKQCPKPAQSARSCTYKRRRRDSTKATSALPQ